MQCALDGAAALDRPVIVTTGPAIDPAYLRLPAGAEVHRVLPHAEAMRRSALVIGHGGYGTTTAALAHGLPLVMLPLHPMIDQPMVARAVQDAGAGPALPKRASSARIASAAGRALGEPGYRAGAARLGTGIPAARAPQRAARAPQRAADAIATVLVAH
ncbi:glycosyltransferase [Yonghaparkia sp. Soil809]|uniref:glycosyltransferase n=1 Tax=Yonghaparkia sp. Soil809 TaxID=1736417 RepID=UPI003511160F